MSEPNNQETNNNIGERIKALRKERNITLSALAESTDLSLGFLSNLERNQTSPTIAHLHKICNALGITLNDILLDTKTSNDITVIRHDERPVLFEQDNGALQYAAMTQGTSNIKVTAMTINSDDLYPFTPHEHEELGIVVQGVLELQTNNKTYFLYPGDSIFIRSGTMHSGRRASEETCISYWVKVIQN